MNIADAAYATVHDYPGGAEALGPRMRIKAGVLRNKVDPNNSGNHLGLMEADRLIGVTGDLRILQAMAAEHDCIVQRCSDLPNAESITELVLDATAASGKFAGEIRAALADGLISENDMRAIGAAGLAEQQVMMTLIARLRAATGKHLRSVGG